MREVIDPLFANQIIRSVDQTRGLITLRADPSSLRVARDDLAALDVPVLAGASSDLLRLRYTSSTDTLGALANLLDQTSLIAAIDIPASNAILLVAKSPTAIDRARALLAMLGAPTQPRAPEQTLF